MRGLTGASGKRTWRARNVVEVLVEKVKSDSADFSKNLLRNVQGRLGERVVRSSVSAVVIDAILQDES